MIQRIQTLYLLLAAAAMAAALFLPWGAFFGADGTVYSYEAFSVARRVGEGSAGISFWALGAILSVCALSSLVAVFFFHKRLTQVRFCVFNMLALIGFYLAYLVFLWVTIRRLDASFGLNFGISLPFVALIFEFLAMNAILNDEKKVRAYERIR
ncbi:MAG: DUF4293 domain-containing protein [Bacteroidales bacterium]|nr:DUF4293 domain-containing protein [Bacteroidales bacterium]